MFRYGAVSDDVNPLSLDEDLADQLWKYSEEICAKIK